MKLKKNYTKTVRDDFQVSLHAEERAAERGVSPSAFWAIHREACRLRVKDRLVEQQQKLMPMLTDKNVHARIGAAEYTASRLEISTKMDVNGVTFVVGIRREGEGESFSPLTVETVWH